MNGKAERIREVAYRIWEEERKPLDQAERHWLTAEEIVSVEGAENRGPASADGADPAAEEKS